MSGNLFPIKLLHLFTELKDAGILDKLACGAYAMAKPVAAPADGLTRLVLCSPEVQQAVLALVETPRFRVRIAVPPPLDFLELSERAALEVYSEEGNLLQPPLLLTSLEDGLANAIQVELFHELLRAKGSSIPLL